MKNRSIAPVAPLAVTARAPAPGGVQEAYVSGVLCCSWTCEQLGEENVRLNQALAMPSVAQNSARMNDTVGIIRIGLPVGSMSGQSIAAQIALYKGQMEAVHRASIRNSCPEMMRILPRGMTPGGAAVLPGVPPQAPTPTQPASLRETPSRAR